MAARDAERFLRPALASVLQQTLVDLELVVVDDASSDATPEILGSVDDPRLRVARNDEPRGLADSLNRALDLARGRFIARLDADDVALPKRLERQVARLEADPSLAVVGSAILELGEDERVRSLHAMPESPHAVRWAALFSSPFYHPTVLLDREALTREGLRYDTGYAESEDYELWTRLLRVVDGGNLPEPLVLYRIHPEQASRRRRGLQRDLQREIALREIASVAPALSARDAELAWRVGASEPIAPSERTRAADAFRELLGGFERTNGRASEVRRAAARALLRLALADGGAQSLALLRAALAVDPGVPADSLRRRLRRRSRARVWGAEARRTLASLAGARAAPLRVVVVSPEPTPYRAPIFDLLAERPELDLTVLYTAETLASRGWVVEPRHATRFLRGVRVPLVGRLLAHDYVLNPGVGSALRDLAPDVAVISGWSTFACQAALLWCRRNGVPYVLHVESHDAGPRPGWRRAVKGAVVPRAVRGAAWILVTGTLVRQSMLERGADPHRIGLFAVTIDVGAFARRAETARRDREALRARLGVREDDVVVLCAARLAPEKGLDTLVRALAATGDSRVVGVVVGEGPERARLEELARRERARVLFPGARPWEAMVETYVAADVFALLSEREPWGVVVNEAAACALPLVLSDRVGAAPDLLRDGENGFLVRARDVSAAADALRRLAADPELRRRQGERSQAIVADWGYGPSVEGFLVAVRRALDATVQR
jgi:glycosyltransferase involved in cell wall biosynthesis